MTLHGACRGANRQYAVFGGTALGYASGLPLGWYLGARREWPRPLLGVWLGNVWALGLAAAWALGVAACVPWAQLRPVGGAADPLLAAPRAAEPPFASTSSWETATDEPLVWPASAVVNERVSPRRT